MYASVCDFVCIDLLIPLVIGFCQSVSFFFLFSIDFSACYHWWICFLLLLLSSFFFLLHFHYFYF